MTSDLIRSPRSRATPWPRWSTFRPSASRATPKTAKASVGPQYLDHLEKRVEWCNQMLAAAQPFEIQTRGIVP